MECAIDLLSMGLFRIFGVAVYKCSQHSGVLLEVVLARQAAIAHIWAAADSDQTEGVAVDVAKEVDFCPVLQGVENEDVAFIGGVGTYFLDATHSVGGDGTVLVQGKAHVVTDAFIVHCELEAPGGGDVRLTAAYSSRSFLPLRACAWKPVAHSSFCSSLRI